MARCQVGRQHHLAEPDRVAVAQHAIDLDGWLAHDLPVVPVVKITLAAVFHHRDIGLHHRQLGAPTIA